MASGEQSTAGPDPQSPRPPPVGSMLRLTDGPLAGRVVIVRQVRPDGSLVVEDNRAR